MRKNEKNVECMLVLWISRSHMIVNMEALLQVIRMYGVGGKLLNRIKSMYVGTQACVRVKWE